MNQGAVMEILRGYRDGLRAALGNELDSVVLYGSQARGEARGDDSDIDVLCVLRQPFNYGAMIERTSRLTAELCLKHDVVISRAFVARTDFDHRQTPFLMNVRREGASI
jgi:predicted nucleotidyltransferase